jgi:hypothetical protein
MISRLLVPAAATALLLMLSGCESSNADAATSPPTVTVTSLPPVTTTPPPPTTTTATTTTTTTTTTVPPTFDLQGVVEDPNGLPLHETLVTADGQTQVTAANGSFEFTAISPGEVVVTRPGWLPTSLDWDGMDSVEIELEPRVVRGLRVSSYVAQDRAMFDALLEQAEGTTVNALVFDTKDESSKVLYDTQSPFAAEIGAINPKYDPAELLGIAKERGYYTITRIVTFEDKTWVRERPDHKLAGVWIDPTNREAWEYPLQLAVEACELGFEEIQFDYVRFPAGKTAAAAQRRKPLTEEQRVDTITSFLAEAKSRLHPLGCALSADIFGIVLSSPDDQGIGQRPEDVSAIVDAVSPMIYPSHYSNGWLGFPNPNDYPGPVVADALDAGMPRLAPDALMRPWLQAFYYNGSQVLAEIAEAEKRGAGWILWNAGGEYADSWLPPATTQED